MDSKVKNHQQLSGLYIFESEEHSALPKTFWHALWSQFTLGENDLSGVLYYSSNIDFASRIRCIGEYKNNKPWVLISIPWVIELLVFIKLRIL